MSSEADKFVLEQALSEQDNSALFQAKRVTYVTDTSSSGGVFNSQIQFDLNTLSSQNQWTHLSEAYVQFPTKLTITSANTLANISNYSACIKQGFHNFVDSVQLVLGGSTIQSSQIFTNVDTSYKILTEWSEDELKKYGPTLGIALDDYQINTDNVVLTTMDNVAIDDLSKAYSGVEYPVLNNKGFRERAQFLNTSVVSTTSAAAIMTGLNTSGKSMVQIKNDTSAAGTVFVAFYLATIRLKDLCDSVKNLPPIKNLKGFLYINYNAASSTYTATKISGIPTAAVVNTSQFGRCQPGMLNKPYVNDVTTGADRVITFKSEISGVADTTLTTAQPAINNARLYVPYYIASPEIDRVLTQTKTIRYNERFVTELNIEAKSSINNTITPGIQNAQRIIILPTLVGDADGSAGLTAMSKTPWLSPFDIAGCGGSSPFAALSELQVYHGNQPSFQAPVNYDHSMFLDEVSKTGANGGLDDQVASGLLNQRLWNQMYRYYTVDLSRRINGDDGASKSIQLACRNATNAKMHLIVVVWYQREIVVDTAMGTITQNM